MNKKNLIYAYILLGSILFIGINNRNINSIDDLSFITNSFTKEAFAEDFGYACYNVDFGNTVDPDLCQNNTVSESICLIPGVAQNIEISTKINNSDANAPKSLVESFIFSQYFELQTIQVNTYPSWLTVNPNIINGFPFGTEEYTWNFNVTADTNSDGETGTANINTSFNDGSNTVSKNASLNITVGQDNDIASLNSITPNTGSFQLTENVNSMNLLVTSNFEDSNNNIVNLTFELSNDDFNTLLQSHSYTNIDSNLFNQLQHTFTNLNAGTYKWRVKLTESNLTNVCQGFANESPASSQEVISTSNTISIAQFTPPITTPSDPTPPTSDTTPNNNVASETAIIRGRLFNDLNKNGKQDLGELGLPNVKVFIYKDANAIVSNSSKNILSTADINGASIFTAITDINGDFTFNVPVGKVKIVIDQTDPNIPAGAILSVGAFEQEFEAKAGENYVETGLYVLSSTGTNTLTLENTGIKPIYLSLITIMTLILINVNPKKIITFIKNKSS